MATAWELERLRRDVRELLAEFEGDVRRVREEYGNLVGLLRMTSEEGALDALARFLGGDGEYPMVGIDGSMAVEERLEILIFHVSAIAYTNTVIIDNRNVSVGRPEPDIGAFVSASIPLWSDLLAEVDSSLGVNVSTEQEFERGVTAIPFSLMTFAELYLAHQLVEGGARIVFLDRLLTVTRGPASRDLSEMMRAGYTSFEGVDLGQGRLTLLDLVMAARLGRAPDIAAGMADPEESRTGFLKTLSEIIPPRPPYTPYFLLGALVKLDYLDYGEIASMMVRRFFEDRAVSEDELREVFYRGRKPRSTHCRYLLRRLRKLSDLHMRLTGSLLLHFDAGGVYLVDNSVKNYWRRAWGLVKGFAERVFSGSGEGHTLRLGSRWASRQDFSALILILLNRLVEDSVSRRVLLIGIAKDTLSTELLRGFIPYVQNVGPPLLLGSDRKFLTLLSSVFSSEVRTPWRTREFDSAFSLIGWMDGGYRAVRGTVIRERRFVRGYFQLWSAPNDPALRSPVFAYDRPFYPEFDSEFLRDLQVRVERFRGEVLIKPFAEDSKGSSLVGDAVLGALLIAHNPNVIESLGHNYLLFLADKHVKHLSRRARGSIMGVADLEIMPISRKYKAFFISRRFRDIRRLAEHGRERGAT